MSGSDLGVFVVKVETTDPWDANCCNSLCGHGLHNLVEDSPSKGAAEKVANAHRWDLRQKIEEES
jgi:hypothetical protein